MISVYTQEKAQQEKKVGGNCQWKNGERLLVAKETHAIGGTYGIDEAREPMRQHQMSDRSPVKGGVRRGSASPLRKTDPPR